MSLDYNKMALVRGNRDLRLRQLAQIITELIRVNYLSYMNCPTYLRKLQWLKFEIDYYNDMRGDIAVCRLLNGTRGSNEDRHLTKDICPGRTEVWKLPTFYHMRFLQPWDEKKRVLANKAVDQINSLEAHEVGAFTRKDSHRTELHHVMCCYYFTDANAPYAYRKASSISFKGHPFDPKAAWASGYMVEAWAMVYRLREEAFHGVVESWE
ncbi:hypothetical protein J3A83DRAFT_4190671 [Scleroderma citrinum]